MATEAVQVETPSKGPWWCPTCRHDLIDMEVTTTVDDFARHDPATGGCGEPVERRHANDGHETPPQPDYSLEDLAPFWPDLNRGQRASIHNVAKTCAEMNREQAG